jgi:hypothetical protein
MATFSSQRRNTPGRVIGQRWQSIGRQDVYIRLSQLASQGDLKKGTGYLQQGLKKASEVQLLLPMLLDMEFQVNDLDGARASIKELEERDSFGSELIRYSKARLKLAEGNFWEASREFEALRPLLARSGYANYTAQLDLFLGGLREPCLTTNSWTWRGGCCR